MGIILRMNRRTTFLLTFLAVLLGWSALHQAILSNNYFDRFESALMLLASFGIAYIVSRRVPPMGRQL